MSRQYEIHLACGDTVSSAVQPRIGAYRYCIHCDGKRKVTGWLDITEQIWRPVSLPPPWYTPLTMGERHTLHSMLADAHHDACKLHVYGMARGLDDKALEGMCAEAYAVFSEIHESVQ